MKINQKIVLVYCVTNNHYDNFKTLEKDLNFKTYYIFENNNIPQGKKKNIINCDEIKKFITKNHRLISVCIFSTCQLRSFPINLLYSIISYKIKSIAIQETNQMFLHSQRMNNYILPMNFYFLNSQYEKNIYLKLNYNSKDLIITGYPYYNINNLNTDNKKKIIIIFNASNIVNPLSLETTKIQKKILEKINKNENEFYKIFVKFHPSENKEYIKNLKNKYKHIKVIDNNINKNFLNDADFVLITGYSQLLLESIISKKKIFILETIDNKNLIKEFDFNKIKIENLSASIDLNKIYIEKNYKKMLLTHLNIKTDIAKKNIVNKINNISSLQNNNYEINLIELLIWKNNLNIDNKNDKIANKIIKKYNFNFLLDNNFKKQQRLDFISVLNNYRNDRLYDSLIIFLIKKLVLNNIYPNKDEFKHIINLNKIYIINYFYWDYQNFINLLYLNKNLGDYYRFTTFLNAILLSYNPNFDFKKKLLINFRNNYIVKKSILFKKLYYYFFKLCFNFRK